MAQVDSRRSTAIEKQFEINCTGAPGYQTDTRIKVNNLESFKKLIIMVTLLVVVKFVEDINYRINVRGNGSSKRRNLNGASVCIYTDRLTF
jgi:hypothetical protein